MASLLMSTLYLNIKMKVVRVDPDELMVSTSYCGACVCIVCSMLYIYVCL